MKLEHPFRDLTRFPTVSPPRQPLAWRIVDRAHAGNPWWFSTTGYNRFDLNPHSDLGTCYLSESLLGALLETIWRDVAPTGDPDVFPPLPPGELTRLVATRVRQSSTHVCVDVSGTAKAVQLYPVYGITEQIGMCDDYQRPQEWAAAWAAHDFDGVHYRLSHGTALLGWAIFGVRGEAPMPAESVHELTAELFAAEGLPPPSTPYLEDLDVIDDPADAVDHLTRGR